MGLLDRAHNGDQRALARLCSLLEAEDPPTLAAIDTLDAPITDIQVIGITGPPGAGKSTLINLLLGELRKGGDRIAVLLVDPSSELSGGAVLGDRIRMLTWGDDSVFVRSQANRGQSGGLAPSTATLIDLFAHVGFDMVLIETVGVGQDGIDIRTLSTTSIVIQSPNQGDSVQSLKAGILEIADMFVVTKADLPGAHQTVRELNNMLQLDHPDVDSRQISVIAVSAQDGRGIDELARQIELRGSAATEHRSTSSLDRRRRWETLKRAEGYLGRAARRLPECALSTTTPRAERVTALLTAALAESERPGSRSGQP